MSDGGLIKTNLVWKLAETWKQASCGSFAFIIFLLESTFLLVGVLFVVTRVFWPALDLSIIFHIHHFMGRHGSILFHLLRERWHTGLKTSDWSRVITWPGYWPLIGREGWHTGLKVSMHSRDDFMFLDPLGHLECPKSCMKSAMCQIIYSISICSSLL